MKLPHSKIIGALLGSLAVTSPPLQAVEWNNPLGGILGEASNWAPSGVPPSTAELSFVNSPSNGTLSIFLDKDETATSLVSRTGDITFDLDGHTLNLLGGTGTYALRLDGQNGTGTTTFRNGTLVTGRIVAIGGGTVAQSRTLVFDNMDVTINNAASAGSLQVGGAAFTGNASTYSGHSLEIINGSVVRALTLAAGAVADSSNNTIRINEGSVLLSGGITIGTSQGRNSNSLNVKGASSHVEARFMQIGHADNANNRFVLDSGNLTISDAPGAAVNYMLAVGAGNSITINGGTLNVENTNKDAYIRASVGSAFIINGGVITTDNLRRDANDGGFTFNKGTINTRKSTHASGAFTVGDGDTDGGIAHLHLLDNGTHAFSSLTISSNGLLTGNGTITGNTTVHGTIAAGATDEVGLLSFTSNLTLQADSNILIEIGGELSADYDQIDVTGILTLGGTLQVVVSEGLSLQLHDSFQLFGAGTFTGAFSNHDFSRAGLSDDLSWFFDQTNGTLTVIPEPTAALLTLICGFILAGPARRTLLARKN